MRLRQLLELSIWNCVGDICSAGVQENNRKVEEARQSLCCELRSLLFRPIWNRSTRFHEYDSIWDRIPKQTQLDPISSPKWYRSNQSRGNARPNYTRNVTIPVGTGPVETLPKVNREVKYELPFYLYWISMERSSFHRPNMLL